MYSIVWKYKVLPGNEEKFQYEYGTNGSWRKLFGKSGDYRGSFLYKSNEQPDTYLLIDTWSTGESYETFKQLYEETYQQLSTLFEYLHESEEFVGTFNAVE